uniref:HTH CENPB-type domain-containing protein n=1 Tax=Pyricularia oryzae (strain P131) TaxID=1143193 RepID=L7IUA6_PYRO1
MADHLLAARDARPVGKQWAYRFVQRRIELKTRFSRAYDFQRALCEDPDALNAWFRLVTNTKAKYGIQDCDIYNFDETGFVMGQICGHMVVTGSERRGKSKKVWIGFIISPIIRNRGQKALIGCWCSMGITATNRRDLRVIAKITT